MIKDFFKRKNKLSNYDDGSPEVAQKFNDANRLAIVLIMLILIIVIGLYLLPNNKKELAKPIEEEFVIPKREKKEFQVSPRSQTKSEIIKPKEDEHQLTERQLVFLQDKQKELQLRLSAPLMTVNETSPESNKKTQEEVLLTDPNLQFMRQVANPKTEVINASPSAPLNTTIYEGSLIHAILETASNSDLPGYLRAIVSEPSYSEDGSQVLIPSGSRLIGRYKSGMLQGQSRIFVVWTRLITPDGISVNLGSPGVDSLGVAGMTADSIDRHFWQRFGTAAVLSIIGAGAANLDASGLDGQNATSQYRSAIANSFSQSANQSLQQNMVVAPTLESYQGKQVMVFVAHDINFEDAIKKTKPRVNIF